MKELRVGEVHTLANISARYTKCQEQMVGQIEYPHNNPRFGFDW